MAKASPRIDGGWGWVIVGACFVNNLLVIGLIKTYGILYVQFMKEFKASASVTSLILGVKAALFSISGLLVFSVLISRVPNRRVAILGAVLTSGGTILSIFADSVAFTVFSQSVLTGIGSAFVFSPGIYLIGEYFEKKRGLAMSVANSGVSIGLMILPPLITILFEEYGFKGGLLLLGGIMMQTIVATALFRPVTQKLDIKRGNKEESLTTDKDTEVVSMIRVESEDELKQLDEDPKDLMETLNEGKGDNDENGKEKNCPKCRSSWSCVLEFLRSMDFSLFLNPVFIVILGFSFFGLIGNELAGIFLPALAREKGLGEMQTATLLTIAAALDLFSRLLPGLVSHFNIMDRPKLMVVAFVLMGIAFQFTRFFHSFETMLIFVVIYGSFAGFFFSLLPVMVIDFVGFKTFPKAFGFIQIAQGVAGSSAYPVLAMFKDLTGNYAVTFHFLGASLLLASGIILTEPLLRKMGEKKARLKNNS